MQARMALGNGFKEYYVKGYYYHTLKEAMKDAREIVITATVNYPRGDPSHIPLWPDGEALMFMKE